MPLLYETVVYRRSVQRFQKSTRIIIFLTKAGTTSPDISGTSLSVGDAVRLRGFLQYQEGTYWYAVKGTKPLKFYHRLGTGAWELIATKNYTADGGTFPADLDNYVLSKAGTHTFYIEFAGDAEYSGCSGREAKIGVGVGLPLISGISNEYLIAGGLGLIGLIFVGLALRRRR